MSSNWIKDYLTFNKQERIAIIILVSMIVSVYFLPSFFPNNFKLPDEKERARFDSLAQLFNEADSEQAKRPMVNFSSTKDEPETELFLFDPNNASAGDWQKLGINEKTIRTIIHYLQKGGRFRSANDLKKIYGLRQADYAKLEPYIRIKNREDVPQGVKYSTTRKALDTIRYNQSSKKEFFVVELNEVDSASLCKLPGIGNKLASRIIHFRDKLGGFYTIEQVAETYGLPDTTFIKIKPFLNLGTKPVTTININEANVDRLRTHPYISWSMARALVQYREQHGPFKAVDDISKISVFGSDQLKRLIPYLSTY